MARKGDRKLFVKMGFVLSASEEGSAAGMLNAEDRRAKEEMILRQAQEQIQKQVQETMEEDKKRE